MPSSAWALHVQPCLRDTLSPFSSSFLFVLFPPFFVVNECAAVLSSNTQITSSGRSVLEDPGAVFLCASLLCTFPSSGYASKIPGVTRWVRCSPVVFLYYSATFRFVSHRLLPPVLYFFYLPTCFEFWRVSFSLCKCVFVHVQMLILFGHLSSVSPSHLGFGYVFPMDWCTSVLISASLFLCPEDVAVRPFWELPVWVGSFPIHSESPQYALLQSSLSLLHLMPCWLFPSFYLFRPSLIVLSPSPVVSRHCLGPYRSLVDDSEVLSTQHSLSSRQTSYGDQGHCRRLKC